MLIYIVDLCMKKTNHNYSSPLYSIVLYSLESFLLSMVLSWPGYSLFSFYILHINYKEQQLKAYYKYYWLVFRFLIYIPLYRSPCASCFHPKQRCAENTNCLTILLFYSLMSCDLISMFLRNTFQAIQYMVLFLS